MFVLNVHKTIKSLIFWIILYPPPQKKKINWIRQLFFSLQWFITHAYNEAQLKDHNIKSMAMSCIDSLKDWQLFYLYRLYFHALERGISNLLFVSAHSATTISNLMNVCLMKVAMS